MKEVRPLSRLTLLAAVAAAALGLAACSSPPSTPAAPTLAPLTAAELPPPEPREFRAAWVATVANIDWPSKPGLSAQTQRAEALAMLDKARQIGLNALILQVRPAADAIYPSTLEPWSEYLSGEQGRGPWLAGEQPWDPLAFWVSQAHLRGIELHVWFNPYRARQQSAKSPASPQHISVRQPALVKRYGEQLWMDPGEPAAAAQTLAVVADVLRRYAVDGVHIDDYFYPYPVTPPGSTTELPFPDDESFARYVAGGGTLARNDWRRDSVNRLVQAMHQTVVRERPGARMGVSPFGIGRPDRRPPGITGFSQYDKLYADVELWFQQGWMDYLAPQLYWPIDRVGQQFPVLLDYWLAQNTAQRHVWAGLFTSLVTKGEPLGPRSWAAREILDQVAVQRSRPAATGHIHFSMVALMQDRDGLATKLMAGPYAVPALVPPTPWRGSTPQPAPPQPPVLRLAAGQAVIEPAPGADVMQWAVWRRSSGQWSFAVQPAAERSVATGGADALVVSAVDRWGQMSSRNVVRLP
jgi:uncharacterized lipoprotein YddW (UPF0748 family)